MRVSNSFDIDRLDLIILLICINHSINFSSAITIMKALVSISQSRKILNFSGVPSYRNFLIVLGLHVKFVHFYQEGKTWLV